MRCGRQIGGGESKTKIDTGPPLDADTTKINRNTQPKWPNGWRETRKR